MATPAGKECGKCIVETSASLSGASPFDFDSSAISFEPLVGIFSGSIASLEDVVKKKVLEVHFKPVMVFLDLVPPSLGTLTSLTGVLGDFAGVIGDMVSIVSDPVGGLKKLAFGPMFDNFDRAADLNLKLDLPTVPSMLRGLDFSGPNMGGLSAPDISVPKVPTLDMDLSINLDLNMKLGKIGSIFGLPTNQMYSKLMGLFNWNAENLKIFLSNINVLNNASGLSFVDKLISTKDIDQFTNYLSQISTKNSEDMFEFFEALSDKPAELIRELSEYTEGSVLVEKMRKLSNVDVEGSAIDVLETIQRSKEFASSFGEGFTQGNLLGKDEYGREIRERGLENISPLDKSLVNSLLDLFDGDGNRMLDYLSNLDIDLSGVNFRGMNLRPPPLPDVNMDMLSKLVLSSVLPALDPLIEAIETMLDPVKDAIIAIPINIAMALIPPPAPAGPIGLAKTISQCLELKATLDKLMQLIPPTNYIKGMFESHFDASGLSFPDSLGLDMKNICSECLVKAMSKLF